jgi:hypothetical protein
MKRHRRTRTRFLVGLTILALALVATVGASAHDGNKGDHGDKKADHGNALFSASLAPSVPTDPAIDGANPGGVPWVIDRSTARVQANGRIRVRIEGLVIPIAHGTFPAGTARPVTTVSASVVCAGGTTATTDTAPISEEGDARIDDTVDLPSTCLAPVVLVHPNGGAGAYIAVSGWRQ